jgi:hypothetical protein
MVNMVIHSPTHSLFIQQTHQKTFSVRALGQDTGLQRWTEGTGLYPGGAQSSEGHTHTHEPMTQNMW